MPRWRGTTVAGVELDIAGDGAFEAPMEPRDVADGERGAVAAVDELARAYAPGVADGERGAVAAVDELACAHAPGVANGERGVVAAVDELARAHAPGVADGEHGAVAVVVLVVKLGRDCN